MKQEFSINGLDGYTAKRDHDGRWLVSAPGRPYFEVAPTAKAAVFKAHKDAKWRATQSAASAS